MDNPTNSLTGGSLPTTIIFGAAEALHPAGDYPKKDYISRSIVHSVGDNREREIEIEPSSDNVRPSNIS